MQPPTRTRKRKDIGPAWTAPDEKATLVGFLDYLRAAIVNKVADVPEPQVRTAGVPSGTSLLGLIKHLTAVERFYFLKEPIADLRRSFRPARGETVEGLLARYRETTAQANRSSKPGPTCRGRRPDHRVAAWRRRSDGS